MKFIHLKVAQCPTCGCSTVVREEIDVSLIYRTGREPQIRHHCNGQRWESRKFLCGCVVEWCPNFERPEMKELCGKHPAVTKYYEDYEAIEKKERKLREESAKLRDVRSEAIAAENVKFHNQKYNVRTKSH